MCPTPKEKKLAFLASTISYNFAVAVRVLVVGEERKEGKGILREPMA